MQIDQAKGVHQLTRQYEFYERLTAQLRSAPKVTGFVANMEFVIPRVVIAEMIRIFEQSQATLKKQIEDYAI